jgi:hypothetical protein
MESDRDLSDCLRPGELGLMRSCEPPDSVGYDADWLDKNYSPQARAILLAIDYWSDGKLPELPTTLQGDNLLSQVAQGLALRLLMVKGKLRSERQMSKHNAGVRLKLGRRANGKDHDGEKKTAAIQLFNELLAKGKLKKAAYKAVTAKYGVAERTMRSWLPKQ